MGRTAGIPSRSMVPFALKSQLTLLIVPVDVLVKVTNVNGAQPFNVSAVKLAVICEWILLVDNKSTNEIIESRMNVFKIGFFYAKFYTAINKRYFIELFKSKIS